MKARVKRLALWLGLSLLLIVALLLALLSLGGTLLHSEAGSAWLLRQVPGLAVSSPQGSLAGGEFSARSIQYRDGATRLDLDGLRWSGLRWHRAQGLWLQIDIASLKADRVNVQLAPSKEPGGAPVSLQSPVGLAIARLEVTELQFDKTQIHDIKAAAQLGASHRLQIAHLRVERIEAAGELSLGGAAPFPLDAKATLQGSAADKPWDAQLQMSGPLAQPAARVELHAARQSLQATAVLRPFEPWPLGELIARMAQLDLSAFSADLPRTQLSGEANLLSSGWQQPARLELRLHNAQAGAWNEGRLPLQSLQATLQGQPDRPDRLALQGLDAHLGHAKLDGGRLRASGELNAQGWSVKAQLDGLQAQALDTRMAALKGSGTARVRLQGKGPMQIELQLDAKPLALSAQAEYAEASLLLKNLRLASGTALLTAQGRAHFGAQLALEATAQLQEFDPQLLWAPAPAGSRLNATLDAKLSLMNARLLGSASAQIAPSSLLGVAVAGKAEFKGSAAGAALDLQLDGGGNTFTLKADQSADAASALLTLNASQLAGLKPLLPHLRPGKPATLGGKLEASLRLDSDAQFNNWRASGRASAEGLQIDTQHLQSAQLEWQAAQALDAPLLLQMQAREGDAAASLNVTGNWARHQVTTKASGSLA
ncbi:MAG TPA: hypothetical protein VGE47_02980, partial [Burkholderiaceae bacterium]